jgi:phosphoribosylformylglycinamidine synthase II
MFSVMWSEHCSYKSSKPLLKTLPTRGNGMMAGVGDNAGVVRIGDGLAVAFKIESHNHPSAVEPYQGAATGVGGILRDIFTMGARPIAVLDALRFGDPTDPHTRHLVDGIVRGVGGYGNCVGVPTVGGELVFDPSYQGNPLVNVMAIGLLEERMLILAEAPGPGNYVVLFGSTTGRDGIGGASVLASATFQDQDPSKRPAVQVGDPFAEKLLIEASLELIDRRLVVGIQDLGAGGISCATSESADKAGTGILLDLDAIPRREPGMAPWEVMISESQERMLATCLPENYPAVREVCERWGIPIALVGRVTTDGDIAIIEGGIGPDGGPNPGATEIARIPAAALTSDAIVHKRVATPPARRRARRRLRVCRSPPTTACRNVAWTPPPSWRRCSAVPTSPAAAGSTSSTTRASRATPSSGPATGPRCCASRAPRRRSWPRPTATRPSASSTRSWALSCPWPKPHATSRSPGRGRSASPTASTTATRSAPRRSGSSRKRSGAWLKRAWR